MALHESDTLEPTIGWLEEDVFEMEFEAARNPLAVKWTDIFLVGYLSLNIYN